MLCVPVDIAIVASFVIESAIRLPRLPVQGETLEGDIYNLAPGGKGTNQAIAAARQGKRVGVVGKVGTDLYGDMAIDLYKKEGVDCQGVLRTNGEQTAIGLVYFLPSGDNCIGLYPGANRLLTAGEVSEGMRKLMPAKVVSAQLESPDEAIGAAFRIAKENGAKVILDPAPARQVGSEILNMVSVLTPNQSEARILAGLDPDDCSVGLGEIGLELLRMGPEAVAITMGENGSLLIEHGKDPRRIKPYLVDTVDALGAGDCFAGSLAVAISEGRPLVEAAEWASVAAALSTRGIGGIAPLPSRKDVSDNIAKR